MQRKRIADSSNLSLPLHQNDLDKGHETKEYCSQYDNLSYRDILATQLFNAISIMYATTFLIHLLYNDNFLHLGKINSLYIPVVHAILEYTKVTSLLPKRVRVNRINYQDVILTYLVLVGFCHCVTVLFGAELTTEIEETFVFSCILSAFVMLPLYFYYGRDSLYLLTLKKTASSPIFASLQKVTYCSIMGAWFGAFVIPLDWNRPWQRWPIPCVFGSMVGFIIGHAYSCISLIE